MMHKSLITAISSLATIALLSITTVHAATYNFTFQSSGAELTATGQFTVDATDQVTGVSGVITGLVDQTINAVTANPGFPSPSYSPDGLFIYDNVYHPTGMPFDVDGLLFVTAQNPSGCWNLWGNSPGNYSLYESTGGNYPIQENGSLSVTPVPELSTWTMIATGFAGLGLVGRRRRTARLAPSLG
jgi:hypothetical protein